jgi:hypothetical protein
VKKFKAVGHALERGHPARSVRGIAAQNAGRMPALQGVFKAVAHAGPLSGTQKARKTFILSVAENLALIFSFSLHHGPERDPSLRSG